MLWYEEEVSVHRQRKSKDTEDKAGSKTKDYHHYRYCPVKGCKSLIKRIPPHLKNVHQLKPGSKAYTDALSQVRGPVKESHMTPYHKRPKASAQEVVLIRDDLEERIKETVRDGDESSVKHPDSIKI